MSASATQPTLFDPGPAEGRLTDRQRTVYEAIDAEGITDTQAGAVLGASERWRASTGREVLNALRRKQLVIRRRTGLWQRTKPKPADNAFGDIPY